MINKRITRVDIQVSILTGIIVICSCSLIFLINYCLSYKDMIYGLQDRVMSIYTYIESTLDASTFDDINTLEDEDTQLYQDMKQKLAGIREATGVRYLYTAKQSEGGEYIYQIDGLPSTSSDFRHVGDLIEPEIIPDIKRALQGENILPSEIKSTSWGYIFISYLPVYADDRIVGVVGIEFAADHQYKTYLLLKLVTPLVIVLACIVAIMIAVVIFKRISNPTFQDYANTDILTGLKNRNAFDIDMNNLNQKSVLSSMGIVSFDMDYLKRVNDTLGHEAGDRYIQNACRIFQQHADVKYILYRIGGDEFAAIVREYDEEAVQRTVDKIEKWIKEEKKKEDPANPVPSISIGFAAYDDEIDADLRDTQKRADQMMYVHKHKKKRIC